MQMNMMWVFYPVLSPAHVFIQKSPADLVFLCIFYVDETSLYYFEVSYSGSWLFYLNILYHHMFIMASRF